MDPAKLVEKVDATGKFAKAGTGITQADFATVLDLVAWALGADQDPLAAVAVDTRSNLYFRKQAAHAVSGLSPAGVLTAGTVVTLYGTDFSARPADNIVLFQSAAGP